MGEAMRIRNRDEIPEEDKWAIEDLYASDELWEEELKTLELDREYLVSFDGKLGESGRTLCEYLEAIETMTTKAEKLACYAMRRSDEDTRDPKYQAMSGKFMSVYVALATACSFDTPEIMAISDEQLENSMENILRWNATADI